MTALAKALIGLASIGAPVAVAVTTTLALKNKPQEEKKEKINNPETPKDCYSITTVPENQKESFLICNNSEFYLHISGEEKPYKKVKSLKIQEQNKILITLEGEENKTLQGNKEEWKDLTKNEEFINKQERNCVVSSTKDSLACTENGSKYQAFNPIPIIVFNGK